MSLFPSSPNCSPVRSPQFAASHHSSNSRPSLLTCNSSTRIRRPDLFMLFALWMELYPSPTPKTTSTPPALPTGAVLVDPKDRVLSLDRTGESHAAVRCLLSASGEVLGSDMFLSRFPCALCMKVMVQAGVRKIYYFPAELWEMEGEGGSTVEIERKNKNRRAVARLVANNSIAMTLFIPQWDHGEISEDMTEFHLEPITILDPSPTTPLPMVPSSPWSIDASIGTAAGIARRWDTIMMKFRRTCLALRMLQEKYAVGVRVWHAAEEQARAFAAAAAASANEAEDLWKETTPPELPVWARHAMVLANIAARRTDDPKLGVGCVLVEDGRYVSVGWNGYPKRAQHLDYPQAGADDSVEDEELKYDYILHSEQNGLLWRNPTGSRIKGGWLICTKMPCDECSPMLHDCGISRVVTVPQLPKSRDDPSRLKGLTYDKVGMLMEEVIVFNL